jgi:Na+/H+-dicarboxylate symporter
MQKTHSYIFILIAIFLGIVTSVCQIDFFIKTAEIVSTVFINFLKLIAAPIVFLSIFSTFLGMNGFKETKILGKRIVTYTVLTTLISALVALSLFLIFDPVKGSIQSENIVTSMQEGSYISFLLNIVPSNLIQAFLENNVIGIAFVAFILGIASFKLSENVKKPLASFFSSLFQLVLKVTELVVLLLPIAIWAFTTILVKELKANSSQFNGLIIYLGVVLGANLIQGFIILPILLKIKGLSPLKIAKGGSKALLLAFFTKSSNATLPVTLQCAESEVLSAINYRAS